MRLLMAIAKPACYNTWDYFEIFSGPETISYGPEPCVKHHHSTP
jgi:hypothetical protein